MGGEDRKWIGGGDQQAARVDVRLVANAPHRSKTPLTPSARTAVWLSVRRLSSTCFDLRLPRDEVCVLPDEESSFDALEEVRIDLLGRGDVIPAAVLGEWQLEFSDDSYVRGDRIPIAEQVGLWHSADEVSGVHRDLLLNWRRARSEDPPIGPLAVAIDPGDPDATGVSLCVNGLPIARDAGAGLPTDLSPNEALGDLSCLAAAHQAALDDGFDPAREALDDVLAAGGIASECTGE